MKRNKLTVLSLLAAGAIAAVLANPTVTSAQVEPPKPAQIVVNDSGRHAERDAAGVLQQYSVTGYAS